MPARTLAKRTRLAANLRAAARRNTATTIHPALIAHRATSKQQMSANFQFGDFTWLCERAALTVCPLLQTPQGVMPTCYARNVVLGSQVWFQPGTCILYNGIMSGWSRALCGNLISWTRWARRLVGADMCMSDVGQTRERDWGAYLGRGSRRDLWDDAQPIIREETCQVMCDRRDRQASNQGRDPQRVELRV